MVANVEIVEEQERVNTSSNTEIVNDSGADGEIVTNEQNEDENGNACREKIDVILENAESDVL